MGRPEALKLAGRYQVLELLSSHRGRQVWRALDLVSRKPLILKGTLGEEGSEEVRSIEGEFRRSRALRHPRIVQALDFGRCHVDQTRLFGAAGFAEYSSTGTEDVAAHPATYHFFTQPLIQGPSLLELRGSLSVPQVERCILELLELVAFLHARAFAQLDLKSAHLLFADDTWYLIDLDQLEKESALATPELSGTLPWLAPEVLRGQGAGWEADLYSVGVMLYEALTGSCPPLEGETLQQKAMWLSASPIPTFPESVHKQAPHLIALGARLLARSPDARPSAEQALEMLGQSRTAWRERAPFSRDVLLEREAVLQQLETLRTSLAGGDEDQSEHAGSGRIAVLTGPRRSGRSRVLEEACIRWQLAGVPAIRIDALEFQDQPLSALQFIATCLDLRAKAASGGDTQAPAQARAKLPMPSATSETSSPEGLIRTLLQQLCREGQAASRASGGAIPVLIDESEALDGLSRQLLLRLAPSIEASGLLLVLVLEESVAEERHVTAESPQSPYLRIATSVLRLEPLSATAVRALVEEGQEVVEGQVLEDLIRLTGGLPGPVMTALATRWRTPGLPWQTLVTTGTIRHQSSPLATLSSQTLRVLECASILQGAFSPALLEALVQETVAPSETVTSTAEQITLSTSLEPLIARGLLMRASSHTVSMDGENNLLRFPSEWLRQELEAGLPEPFRISLHRRAARFLELETSAGEQLPAEALARHLLGAGQTERALPYLRGAVSAATDAGRTTDAAHWLRTWRDALPANAASRAELQRQLGEIELTLEHAEAAREAFTSALEDSRLPLRARRMALAGRARASLLLGKLPESDADLVAALDGGVGLQGADAPERVRWQHRRVWILINQRRLDAAHALLLEAEAEAECEPTLHIEQLCYRAWCQIEAGNSLTTAAQWLEQAASQARELGYFPGLLMALNLTARLDQLREAYEGARAALEESIAVSRARFDLAREATACMNLVQVLRKLKRAADAPPHLERAAVLFAYLGNPVLESKALLTAVDLMLGARHITRADRQLRRLETLMAPLPPLAPERDWHMVSSCRLRLLRGDATLNEATPGGTLDQRLLEACARLQEAGWWIVALRALLTRIELRIDLRPDAQSLETCATLLQEAEQLAKQVDMPDVVADLLDLTARYQHHLAPLSSPALPSSPGIQSASPPPPQTFFQLEIGTLIARIIELIRDASHEADLAVGLARLAGELVGGRGLVVLKREAPAIPKREKRETVTSIRGARRKHPHTSPVAVQVVKGHRISAPDAMDISKRILSRVLETGEAYECHDVAGDSSLSMMKSLTAAAVHSVICVPIKTKTHCIGALYLDHPVTRHLDAQPVREAVGQIARLCGELLETTIGIPPAAPVDVPKIEGFLGDSVAAREVRRQVHELVEYGKPSPRVLLLGPPGVGKTELAETIHNLLLKKHGRKGKFIRVPCAGITIDTFNTDFFGHAKGTYTGVGERIGYLEEAFGGTILLDDPDTLSPEVQGLLLSTMDRTSYRRGGDGKVLPLDVTFLTATNKDLYALVKLGLFRLDLLTRIDRDKTQIRLPALWELGAEVIEALALHRLRELVQLPAEASLDLEMFFTPPAIRFLFQHQWDGNARQLLGLFANPRIRKCVVMGQKISREMLEGLFAPAMGLGGALEAEPHPTSGDPLPPAGMSWSELKEWTHALWKQYLLREIEHRHGNKELTAKELRMSRNLLYDRIKWPGARLANDPGDPADQSEEAAELAAEQE